ncbi:MAG: M61 family metallopeptidase [Gammaproteobacteria bacterium]|nr:M61 family metallopeptidase [Gammaproteobacteria bacterium]
MFKYLISLNILFTILAVSASPSVEYRISIEQPVHHLATVEVDFPEHKTDTLVVQLPAWRSGRYEILDLANGIRDFSVSAKRGKVVKWEFLDKSSWKIKTDGQAVTVSYQVYANQLGYRSRHIDDTHAFLDASGVFIYSQELRNLPVTVELSVPKKWRSRSGMESTGRHEFKAANYDVLVDSPIETGLHTFYEFSVDDRDYELLFWGKGNYDAKQIESDLIKLDKEVKNIWGSFPYSRYVYMVHATSGARGATEHLNSTVIQRHRDAFKKRDDYLEFISTAAHELIHTWNVKAYRPKALTPYDYQQESYTPLLWVAEGSTSYYDNLIVRRAGISTQKEHHEQLQKSIEALLNRPGREIQSVSDSSLYKWIEGTNDFTINHGVNIYAKGSLVSWWLDFEIRRVTNNQKSYDNVHRLLYEKYNAIDNGFTDQDLLALVNQVTEQDFTQFWKDYVWGTKAIPFEKMLTFVGLELVRKNIDEQAIDLGISFNDDLEITRVKRNGPAWKAGITTDDRLVAIGGMRVTSKNLKDKIKSLKSGQSISVHVFRRDELTSIEVQAKPNPDKDLIIKVVDNPTAAQQQHYLSWTGHPLKDVEQSKD